MPFLFGALDAVALLYRQADASSGILTLCRQFGVPVLATSHGEIGRIVRDERLGAVADPAHPEAVYSSLLQVMAGDDGRPGAAENERAYRNACGTQHRLYRELLEAE
jgi:hypothetical protein